MAELALTMPAFDEEEVIAATVRELCAAFVDVDLQLVVVDNGSRDGTGAAIDGLVAEGLPVTKVHVPVNRGYGFGVRAGLAACDAPWVGFLCADGQVSGADVRALYAKAVGLSAPALVKVRRRFRKDGGDRKLVSVAYNLAANVLYGGLGSIDLNGNPKLLPGATLATMDLRSDDWLLDLELMRKARARGCP
ncbi:MAG: glycosyltransferase [Alphaproteobacteria bacterium]|nr:glycosyltransferase [Alphaproteobacteria bacterium]